MQLSAVALQRLMSHLEATEQLEPSVAARVAATGPRDLALLAETLARPTSTLVKALADLAHIPYLDLTSITPAPQALATVPEALARRFNCLPLFLNGAELTLALCDPGLVSLDALRRDLQAFDLIVVLVEEQQLSPLLDLAYPSAAEAAVAGFLVQDGVHDAARLRALGERPPVVKMVEAILERAARQGASDVHIEPFEGRSRVRYRLDGLLRPIFSFDVALHEAIVSRLKILANLNILERQRPQDGRFAFSAGKENLEARLSTLPLMHGEKAVMRLVRSRQVELLSIDDLGMPEEILAKWRSLLDQPYGLLLVTGPTGSGKTSTLYAALRHLNSGERNLVSLEDPVEQQLEGINQMPLRSESGPGFASALRAVLRQDPDVVMIGEIRDQETAEIAVRAALTGHQVLSTLHTNDALGTLTRLLEIGVMPFNLAPSLLGVISQRLVRRLCTCHAYAPASFDLLVKLGFGYLGPELRLPVPRGCLECDQTGYRGRQVLFELLVLDERMRQIILAGADAEGLRRAAREAGMRPLLSAGMREVLRGNTSLEEVLRVVNHVR